MMREAESDRDASLLAVEMEEGVAGQIQAFLYISKGKVLDSPLKPPEETSPDIILIFSP